MTKQTFYDRTKIFPLSDLNGNKPEIYIVIGKRDTGKTEYFSKYAVNRLKYYDRTNIL